MGTILYVHQFITSMVFTCLVETAVIFSLLVYFYKEKRLNTKLILFAGLFASFATIPYVWFIFPYAGHWTRSTSLLVSEPAVFVMEAIFYRFVLGIEWKKAFVLSLVANAASYFLGPILRGAGLWIYW